MCNIFIASTLWYIILSPTTILARCAEASASVGRRSSRHQDNKTIQALKNSISSCLLSLCSIQHELYHVNDMLDGLVEKMWDSAFLFVDRGSFEEIRTLEI